MTAFGRSCLQTDKQCRDAAVYKQTNNAVTQLFTNRQTIKLHKWLLLLGIDTVFYIGCSIIVAVPRPSWTSDMNYGERSLSALEKPKHRLPGFTLYVTHIMWDAVS